jgi:hypothetical protein
MKALPSKVVIAGAGPSGLFAARRLKQLATEQNKKIEIILLTPDSWVGGKCHTFSDPSRPALKTEWGAALVAPNYGVVLDAMSEHQMGFERVMPVNEQGMELEQLFNSASASQKFKIAMALASEIYSFNSDYDVYKKAKQNRKPLPNDLLIPVSEYCARNNMVYLPMLLKPFVPGFGYGAITHCPTYAVLEYLGKVTIPDMLVADKIIGRPSLLAIKGGFQLLMENIAAQFDVRLNANITQVQRSQNSVKVTYKYKGAEFTETADKFILATSPKNWGSMGMDLTEVEQKCIDQLEYYRYPVAVYRIKGLPPKQYFFPDALEEEEFGNLALITTRDNRQQPEEGRLCTVYVNLPPNQNNFQLDHKKIKNNLGSIQNISDVEVLEEKIWEDYMSTLPWNLRLALDNEQQFTNTLYLGSYALGAFEDVACVANKAADLISEQYAPHVYYEEEATRKNLQRAFKFFTSGINSPYNSPAKEKRSQLKDNAILGEVDRGEEQENMGFFENYNSKYGL